MAVPILRLRVKRFAASGITANVVAPGVAENSVSKPLHEIPMGRLALLQEIAQAVAEGVRAAFEVMFKEYAIYKVGGVQTVRKRAEREPDHE